jgi:hypothetical protein
MEPRLFLHHKIVLSAVRIKLDRIKIRTKTALVPKIPLEERCLHLTQSCYEKISKTLNYPRYSVIKVKVMKIAKPFLN